MSQGRRRSSVKEVVRADDGVARVNDDAFRRLSLAHPEIGEQAEIAKQATDMEKALTVKQALKLYKKAICYSACLSLAVVMEGYDLNVTNSFFGYASFLRRFGAETDALGNPTISPNWQAGVLNGTLVGQVIGLYLNGYLSEWLGYRKTVILALIASACFNFIHFFAQSIGMVLAGSVLMGLPWGIYQTLTLTYASDITPATLRPYLTTYVNICWVMGQLIASGVLRGCGEIDNDWGWRIPFAIQWVWVPIIGLGAYMAPESPWWCVRKGRYDQARRSLERLTSRGDPSVYDVDKALTLIKHTNELEHAINEGVGYLNTVAPIERRRTLIAAIVWLAQAWCGAAIMGYSVQIFQQAGLAQQDALNLAIGQYSLGIVGTVIAWFTMTYIGRRKLYFYGLCALTGFLLIIGGLGVISRDVNAAAWALGAMILVYTFTYNCTVGPVCYAIVAEMPSTRVKIKTIVIARNVYNIGGLLNNFLVPRMLSPNDWDLGGMTGFPYAGLAAALAVFMYFMLPETKGRTYAELDILFENRVSARKFHKTSVDSFAGQNTELRYDEDSRSSDNDSKQQEKAVLRHTEQV